MNGHVQMSSIFAADAQPVTGKAGCGWCVQKRVWLQKKMRSVQQTTVTS